MQCEQCHANVTDKTYLKAYFDWCNKGEEECQFCEEYDMKCESCIGNDVKCEHKDDYTYGPGKFHGIVTPNKNGFAIFCSYQHLEDFTGGELYWKDDSGFTSFNKDQVQCRLIDVEETCQKCGNQVEHDWILCYVHDPSLQYKALYRKPNKITYDI